MKAKPILEKYQYKKAIELYLKRMIDPFYTKYPLNKKGIFVGSTPSGDFGQNTRTYYEGRYKDVIIQFILDGAYFNEWIDCSFNQINNCNNGVLDLWKPEIIKPKKVKKYLP